MKRNASPLLGLSLLTLAACESATAPAPDADAAPADVVANVTDTSTGADAAVASADTHMDAAVDEVPGPAAVPARLFEVIDDLDHDEGREIGFICPIGLCSWFRRPVDSMGVSLQADLVTPSPTRGLSQKAWHLRTTPDSAGVDVRLDIHAPGFPIVLYPDLRNYAGIAFWARGDGEDEQLLVAIEDDQVIAPSYKEAAAGPKPWFIRDLHIGTGWRRHILLFDDFQQVDASGNASGSSKLNTAAVWSIHFIAGLARRTGGVWVDDLALLCRGPCPAPPFELPATSTANGLKDQDLQWAGSSSSEPDLRCAELAALSVTPADQWPAGPGQQVFLRTRVAANPSAAVPLWGWTVEKLPQGPRLQVTALDPANSLVFVAVPEPGQYRVRAHTHYPGMAACGVELIATANAR